MPRIITVSSGKGGVGKTHISTNLALYLAQLGHKTCLLDADLGLANVSILLKLYPERTLKDVIFEKIPLRDILVRTPEGLDILPGSSGIEAMTALPAAELQTLIQEFSTLAVYDYILVDTAAGISRDVLAFCLAASELLLILTPDPASLTDAYALLKVLRLNGFTQPVFVIMNHASGMEKARMVLLKLLAAARTHLQMELFPIGIIPKDSAVENALAEQKALILRYPQSLAAKGIRNAAQNLIQKNLAIIENLYPQIFFEKFLRFLKTPLKKTQEKIQNPEEPILLPGNPENPPSLPKPLAGTLETAHSPAFPESGNPAFSPEKLPVHPPPLPQESAFTPDQTQRLLQDLAQGMQAIASELKEIRSFLTHTPPFSPPRTHHPLTAVVSGYPAFQSLDPQQLQEVLQRMKAREYEAGSLLLQKGDRGKHLFVLVSGRVAVMDTQGGVLDTMEGGDVFGEMSLISGEPINATIKAMENSKVLYLEGRQFMRMLQTYPDMQMYFARLLSQRLAKRLQKADLANIGSSGAGLSGSLETTGIPELLQMLKMGEKTGLLLFIFPEIRAAISLIHGEMVAARHGAHREKEAFYRILREKKGRFIYNPELPERDKDKPPMGHFMKLLMDGVSLMDEEGNGA